MAAILPLQESINLLQNEGTSEDDKRNAMLPNKHAISALRAANIPYIDTTERLLQQRPIQEAYLLWDGHFNANPSSTVGVENKFFSIFYRAASSADGKCGRLGCHRRKL